MRGLARFSALAATSAAILGLAGATEDDRATANLLRLRAMPPAVRQILIRRLASFDALPTSEQEAIRALDRDVTAADPALRARYEALLDHYAAWSRGLKPAQRKKIEEAAPADRIALIRAILETPRPDNAPPDRVETLAALSPKLNPLSLIDQAHYITVWMALTPDQKAQIEAASPAERSRRLETLGRELNVADARPARLKRVQQELDDRLASRAAAAAGKKVEMIRDLPKNELARRAAEIRFLTRGDFRPVEPRRLERFATSLPGWFRQTFDSLPPDAARLRLALLYRLIYPRDEMPEPAEPDEAAPASPGAAETATPRPSPAPPAATGTTPF